MQQAKADASQSRTDGLDRRSFLAAGLAGSLAGGCASTRHAPRPGVGTGGPNTAGNLQDNIYTRLLGVHPHLGAHEHISRLGGSRMPDEVIQALVEANEYFVDMHELTAAAGRRVAELMGAEAALVTAGGFSAMLLGAAACLTGTDEEKMRALPHPTWDKRDCLLQTAHRFSYDHAYASAGARLVYVESREDLVARIDRNTAMLACVTAVERGTASERSRCRASQTGYHRRASMHGRDSLLLERPL